jgi:hypothetical protein
MVVAMAMKTNIPTTIITFLWFLLILAQHAHLARASFCSRRIRFWVARHGYGSTPLLPLVKMFLVAQLCVVAGVRPISRSEVVMLTLESAAGLLEWSVEWSILYSFSLLKDRMLSMSSTVEILRLLDEGWLAGEGRVIVRMFVIAGDFSFKEAILAVIVDYSCS